MRNLFYQERTINDKLSELEKYLARVDYLNVKLDFSDEGEEEYIEKEIEQVYDKFNGSIKELYLMLLNYFEAQNSKELLTLFKKDLSHILDHNYKAIQTVEDPDFAQVYYICDELYSIKKFLLPFMVFPETLRFYFRQTLKR
jgi:hypothetical protein